MRKHALSAWSRVGLHHLLPCACALCDAVQDDLVCNGHTDDLTSHLHRRRCIQYTTALDARHAARHCHTCLADASGFDATVVITDYAWLLNHLITGLKFRAQLSLADWLAAQLGNALAAAPGDPPDILLPVSLSPARLRSYGYNQVWEVARQIARRLDTPAHASALQRVRDNVVRATLDRAKRLASLHGAFVVAEPACIAGRHIGIVDDVMTTSTTLGKTATQLKRVGVARVTNVVALRMS